jgi:tRNA A37 methylthiotransferase MiaB
MRKQKIAQYRKFLTANGHEIVNTPEESEAIIIWTCAFRADFRDCSIDLIEHLQRKYQSRLIITGCLPDIAPELLSRFNNVEIVPWKKDTAGFNRIFSTDQELETFAQIYIGDHKCENAESYRKENPDQDVTFHDQFIKLVISEGCNFTCSYCSERLAFPPFKSFPEDKLIESCRAMVEKTGFYDIMLLADSLGQYGSDIGTNFPALVRKLRGIDSRITFAFNNFNPANFIEFFEDIRFFIKEGYIKHLNLPIQCASDKLLKLMERTYTKKDLIRIFNLLKELEFKAYDTHIIIGFPGETDEDLKETLDFILEYRPRYVLASKYMGSGNAPSAKLPGKVDDVTALKRLNIAAKILKEAGIICNSDGSELSKQRLQRMFNKI